MDSIDPIEVREVVCRCLAMGIPPPTRGGAGVTIERSDVGCWIVKCNPVTGTDYFGLLDAEPQDVGEGLHDDNWCLSPRSGRRTLIEKGDLIALWVTGPQNPGIYEFGWVTEPPVVGQPEPKVHYAAVRLGLDDHIPRSLLQVTPGLDRCEQLRAPMMSNPSYLTVAEARVLARLIAALVPDDRMAASRWDLLLD
jgi:hypothetical protein